MVQVFESLLDMKKEMNAVVEFKLGRRVRNSKKADYNNKKVKVGKTMGKLIS